MTAPKPIITPNTSIDRLTRLATFLQVDPDNALLLRDHAACATHAGQYTKALQSLSRLQHLKVTVADDFALMSFCLRSSGALDEAVPLLESALAEFPDHPWLQLERAGIALQTRNFEEALALLPPQLEDEGLISLAADYRIRCLHHLGKLDEAWEFAQQELAKRPDDIRVKSSICPVLNDLEKLDEASALAYQILEQVGPRYDILETLAADAIRNGDAAGATKWVSTALETRKDDGRTWLLDGLINFRQGDAAAAVRSMEQAIALMPQHAGSYIALGWVHLVNQNAQQAMEVFRQGTEASPAFAEAYGSQAVAAFALGDREQAALLARKARLLDANSPTAQYASLLLSGAPIADVRVLGEQILQRTGAQPMQKHLDSMAKQFQNKESKD